KKQNVSRPRLSIVAGSPYLADSVPAGSRRRSTGTPSASPAAVSTAPTITLGTLSVLALASGASPVAEPSASVSPPTTGPRRRATPARPRGRGGPPPPRGAGGGRSRNGAGMATGPVSAMNGSNPRNTHRQPKYFATSALSAGPARPGATHAVDSTAIIRA